jgi:hypothetical protein
MEDTKKWYESTTIRGIVVMILGFVANRWFPHWGVTDADLAELVGIVLTAVGSILAVVGRVKARTQITL